MKKVWILRRSIEHPQTDLLKELLRSSGFIVQVEQLYEVVKKIQAGDIIFGIDWDVDIVDARQKLKEAGVDPASVKLVGIVRWEPTFQYQEVIAEEHSHLKELDLAMVRSQYEKDCIMRAHTEFEPSDMHVVGGLESYFDILNSCMKVSWQARENKVVFPYEFNSIEMNEADTLIAEYNFCYPKEKLELLKTFAMYDTKGQYLKAISSAKVVYGAFPEYWPTEVIKASFLGIYPMVPDAGIYKELVADEFRTGDSLEERIEKLHSLVTKQEASPIICFACESMCDLLKAL